MRISTTSSSNAAESQSRISTNELTNARKVNLVNGSYLTMLIAFMLFVIQIVVTYLSAS
jgi:hypothetical protein